MISCPSPLLPTRPIAGYCRCLHLSQLSLLQPFSSLPLSLAVPPSILPPYLAFIPALSRIPSASRARAAPAVPVSVCPFIRLSDSLTSAPVVVPFVSADK